jgi:hypothetical protein
MVLTAYFALSSVTGLFCHRHLRIKALSARSGAQNLRKLDASVGASGPHDFAVRGFRLRHRYRLVPPKPWRSRKGAVRQRAVDGSREARPAITSRARHCHVHRIPFRVRDDRDTPLCGTGRRGYKLIWVGRKAKFRKFRNKFSPAFAFPLNGTFETCRTSR